ncbi:hypothetical protein EZV73_17530 [Acidaminobacter sp. JC074]|uniref:hypothetical protein n=1 Tax=Acidaminobacter sp. JC074 TaxID=2530199 RepID=UPI001F113635|nr:hypothetical protein [Acidaminobacter sp. JC074]MCH4889404.1 hypothetical protein [Acidaminobacter sp. JC074]
MKLELFKVLGESFSYLKDNWKRYIGTTLIQIGIMVLIFIIPMSVWDKSEAVPTSIFYGAGLSFLWLFVMMIPWIVLSVVFRNVYMAITDDAYEGREIPFKEQWKYAFKKCGSVLLAVIIYSVPIFIVAFVIQWFVVKNSPVLEFVLNISINIVSILFILTEAAILVDDCSAIDGIKKSIEIMKHNIFRYIGFAIGLGFLIAVPMMLIPFIIEVEFMIYVMLILFIPLMIYLAPIHDVFQTLLYKSATEPEDMLEEMLINDVE